MKKLALLLLYASIVFGTTLTGTLQSPTGGAATGTLYLTPPSDVSLLVSCGGTGGGQGGVSPATIAITVTAGALQSPPAVVGNDCMNPPSTSYTVELRESNQNRSIGRWSITGSTFDVSAQTTGSNGPVQLSPTSTQTISQPPGTKLVINTLNALTLLPPVTLFTNLPVAAAGNINQVYEVTDCLTSSCTAGSGTTRAWLASTGSAWVLLGGSGGGGGALPAGSAGQIDYTLNPTTFGASANFVRNLTTGVVTVSTPVVPIGSELITNGGFVGSAAGWTLGNDVAYGTNNVVSTKTMGGDATIQQDITTTSGFYYQIQMTVSAANAPATVYFNNNSAWNLGPFSCINATCTVFFVADFTGVDQIIFDDNNSVVGDTWTLTGVSLKQINPVVSPLLLTSPYGQPALILNDFLANVGVGSKVFGSAIAGVQNVAVGYLALGSETTGRNNVAMGALALSSNTSGNGNTATGTGSLQENTTGNFNTAAGGSLGRNTTGSGNSAIGSGALSDNTTGSNNVAIGFTALNDSLTGSGNIAIGYQTLYSIQTVDNNVGVGNEALRQAVGAANVAIGNFAGAYELGGNAFYINNQDRTDTAGDKAGSLLYGTFDATPGNQTLRINATLTVLDLATTGAATGKTLVCADTNGKLYRSSSGVACAN